MTIRPIRHVDTYTVSDVGCHMHMVFETLKVPNFRTQNNHIRRQSSIMSYHISFNYSIVDIIIGNVR